MTRCYFVSDLHGHRDRFDKLFQRIRQECPATVFIGGDVLPTGGSMVDTHPASIASQLIEDLTELRRDLGDACPRVFLILGNDDPRTAEPEMVAAAEDGALEYIHNSEARLSEYLVLGYSYVPPTPFLLKDWERYDVSRSVDPGCVSPEEGYRTVAVSERDARYCTIAADLKRYDSPDLDVTRAVFLFHAPPYDTALDRAALDGVMFEGVPMEVHVGSIAVRRFIEKRQPWLTLHGHVHESARLTGRWKQQLGRTWMFSAAHDGPELALIRFSLEAPQDATRELL